jgi:hypothetical protein
MRLPPDPLPIDDYPGPEASLSLKGSAGVAPTYLSMVQLEWAPFTIRIASAR